MIQHVSDNGYHYSWDWDGVHFVNVNLFPGNVWEGEAVAYGRGHDPLFARDFLIADLRRNVGTSGRPVVITVTVTNQGVGPATNFWVDFYINPSSVPTHKPPPLPAAELYRSVQLVSPQLVAAPPQ